jgi:hypothetical protein
MMKSLLALNALNFFMADVRDGLGPFLAGLVAPEFGYSAAFVALGAIAAIRLALWLMAPPTVGPTNGIRDRLQIMHSGPSRKLDGAARPPDAAGACV